MKGLISVFVTCLLFSHAYAKTTEGLACEYYHDVQQENWDELGSYYSDDALEEFRELFGIIFKIPDEDDQQEIVELLFGEKTTAKDIEKMSDEEFFNEVMKAIYSLIGKVALLDYDSVRVIGSVHETDDIVHVVSRCQLNIGINDDDDMDLAPISMELMEVLSFEKVENEWKLMLDPKIRALAQQVRNAMDL